MIEYFTETHSAETVNARMGPDINPRLRTVMASLIQNGKPSPYWHSVSGSSASIAS